MNPYKEFTRLGNVTIERIQSDGRTENINTETSNEKPEQSTSSNIHQNYLNFRLPPGINLTIKPVNDTTKALENDITPFEKHTDENDKPKETPDDRFDDTNEIQADTQPRPEQSEGSCNGDNLKEKVDEELVNTDRSPKRNSSDQSDDKSDFSELDDVDSEGSNDEWRQNKSNERVCEEHENTDEEMTEQKHEETIDEIDDKSDELSKETVSQEQSDPYDFENESDVKEEMDEIVDPSIIVKEERIDDYPEDGIDDKELNDNMQITETIATTPQDNEDHEKDESSESVPEKDSSEKMEQSDDADDELEEEGEGENKKKKRTQSSEEDTDDTSTGKKKRRKSSGKGSASSSDSEGKSAAELKVGNMRRNIREVMDETKLEEATLNAQRQEMERLRRVQEQQKIIRDALQAQRQIAVNRQNNKTQARVLSLLQGGSTSLIRKGSEEDVPLESENKKPNTVVVKLSTGTGPPQLVNRKMLDLLKNQNTAPVEVDSTPSDNRLKNLSKNLGKPHMMTASVSIAPVKPGQRKIPEDDKGKEKEKDKGTVTVSSSDEDDCIVISGPSDEEEIAEEDPSNSGMHTSDIYNVPDDQGRVLINVGHPPDESDVFLAPQIARIIKPHQIGGVRFLFDNIVESIDRYKTSEGFGCILAHSMGLGKTLQVISFCDVFLRYTDGKSILCIMPINTLQNWVAEFNMWLPSDVDSSPFKEDGEVLPRKFPLFVLNDNQKTMSARAGVIENWHKQGGVLLIGYELYRQLSLKKPRKPRRSANKKTEQEEELDEVKSKNLLNEIHEALVKPGPDLVICDEGHRIKNSHASISQALKQIRSKRRVVLTGYPLQNNLLEYWCMVDFVRPNYLGTKTEFSNMFERPIQNGQCIDSTPQDIKLMRYRAHVLHSLLQGFVQRRSHAVLQQTLPQKYEYVLLLRLTSFQRKLYNTFMNDVVRTKAVPNPLKAFAVCCKIWNHPDILYNFLKKRAGEEDIDLDLDETVGCNVTSGSDPNTPVIPSTPPTSLPSKRTRGRGVRGSQSREPRARKNAKVKAVPSTEKIPEPEKPQPTEIGQFEPPSPYGNQYSSSQSTPSEMSYDGNQYPTFTGQPTTIAPSSTNFTENPYYQQSYCDNFYQGGGYGQNNYWQGNDNNPTGYYNTSSNNTDNYYANQYNSTNDNNTQYYQTRMPYPNSNFQMRQETPIDNNMLRSLSKSESNFQTDYNLQSDRIKIKEELSSESTQSSSSSAATSDATITNFNHTFNMQNQDIKPNAQQTLDMVSSLRAMQSQSQPQMGFVGRGAQNRAQTTRGTPRRGRRPRAGSTLGRPPLIRNEQFADKSLSYPQLSHTQGNLPFNHSFSNQSNANPLIHQNQNLSELFKPGLLGGAQNFQGAKPTTNLSNVPNFQSTATPDNDGQSNQIINNFQYGQDSLNPSSQLNSGFLNTLSNDNLWGGYNNLENSAFPEPPVDPNMQLFNTQNNLIHLQSPYYSGTANNTSIMAPSTSRTLFNETPHYLPSHNEYPNSIQTPDQGLYNLSQFSTNYLNDMQTTTPGHNTMIRPLAQYNQCSPERNFMGLLTGIDEQQPMATQQQSMATQQQTPFTNFSQNVVAQKFPMNFVQPNNDLSSKTSYDSLYPTFTGKSETIVTQKLQEVDMKNDIYDRGIQENNQFSTNYLIGSNQQISSLQKVENNEKTPMGHCESIKDANTNEFITEKTTTDTRLPSLNFFQNSQNLSTTDYQHNHQRPTSEFGNTDSSWNIDNVSMDGKDNMKRVIETVSEKQQQVNENSFNNYDDVTQEKIKEEPDVKSQPPSTASILKEIDERYFGKNRGPPSDSVPGKSVLSSLVSDNDKKNKQINEDMQKKNLDINEDELEEGEIRMPVPDSTVTRSAKEEPIPYEWTNEFFNDYEPGKLEASAKMVVFFCMLHEIIVLGDRLLLFSQSLFTLDLIEDFLHMHNVPGKEEKWIRNINYYRLDGSTTACERERLINEFNINTDIHLFLVSTRAGSLGINLVGANRVIVFDASWNPCHDTQAVCRVYRYGQEKPCYVYRFVMDHCLEKKIYDRQINKQGMSDRVVDECNPDAHLTIKDVTNLCWDSGDECESKDFTETIDKYADVVVKKVIEKYSPLLSKEPFQHESLLIDRKDKQLSLAEKRMAKRSYELEKRANIRPSYGVYGPNNPHSMMRKPMSGVRPMQNNNMQFPRDVRKWIPAEVWQKQGMNAQEMTLPLDVVIPTNTSDTRASIVLKAGQKVMVLRSPKGIYMQLENGKIIAIKTQLKNTASGNNKSIGPVRGNVSQSNNIRQLRNVLSTRKDITLAPVRNRMMVPGGVRHNSYRNTKPHHVMGRNNNLPISRPRHHSKAIGNKIFGPNSPVTITVSKTKAENVTKPSVLTVKDIKSNSIDKLRKSNREDEQRRNKEINQNKISDDNMGTRQEITGSPPIQTEVKEDTTDVVNSDKNEQREQIEADDKRNKETLRSDNIRNQVEQMRINKELSVKKVNSRLEQSQSKFVIPESLRMSRSINLTPIKMETHVKSPDLVAEQNTIPETVVKRQDMNLIPVCSSNSRGEEIKSAPPVIQNNNLKSNSSVSIMPVTGTSKSPGTQDRIDYYTEYPSSSSHFMNYYQGGDQSNSQFLPPSAYNPFTTTSNTFNTQSTIRNTMPDFRSNQYDNNYQPTYDSFNQTASHLQTHYGNQSTSTTSFDPYTQYNQYYDNYNLHGDNSFRPPSQPPPPQSPQAPKPL